MNTIYKKALLERKTDSPILTEILGRWSPRNMTGELITDKQLLTLFEAARWAPSAYNEQPWKFLYAKRDDENWNLFFDPLVEFNQSWTKNASALMTIISKKIFTLNNKENPTHHFDAGAAWMALAIQGASMGLVVHGMSGFDYDKAREALAIPDEYSIEAMCAIGIYNESSPLPDELEEKEKISQRKNIDEIIIKGKFT